MVIFAFEIANSSNSLTRYLITLLYYIMKRGFVFQTPRYREEATSHNSENVYQRFKKKVEIHHLMHPLSKEYSTIKEHRYVRLRHDNLRTVLLFEEKRINGVDVFVYVALRDFNHDDEYRRFFKPLTPKSERDTITGVNSIDWDSIEKEISVRIAEDKDILSPCISEAERLFIEESNGINQEIMPEWVYETRTWKEEMIKGDFKEYGTAEKLEESFIEHSDDEDGLYETSLEFADTRILFYKNGTVFYLLEIGDEIKKEKWKNISVDEIKKDCVRGYPCSFLDDKDEWSNMEQDENSNFILSDEERSIITEPQNYPLFISGRAGSGKSTVLQYKFAELLLQYLIIKKNYPEYCLNPPTYLSYSDNLIRNALKLTKSLFQYNHVYKRKQTENGISFKNDVEPELKNDFCVFSDLVKQCIKEKNPEIIQSRFNDFNHITFTRFKIEWSKRFGRNNKLPKNIGPSLSWHIINTYIKGWDIESYLTPDDYKMIGRENQSVTDTVYETVYDMVWNKWYYQYCKDNHYWDDQDLVRYCLAPDDNSQISYVSERFSSIFCDEAQDFTRIEIDFIQQLSIFSNRTLTDTDKDLIFKIPFVFAGDEFQTLNPTGFRWDILKTYFMQSLCESCNIESVSAPEPIPLNQNYRSAPPIVKLGNRFQLLRATRFKMKSDPQTPHFQIESSPVLCLSPQDDRVWDKLKENSVVLIVPIPEGQSKEEYIKNSPIKDKIEFSENGTAKGITILTPAQAKGLEYQNVAVYGFEFSDEREQLRIDKLLEWYFDINNDGDIENAENTIAMKYQISNAYVAVTRAKRKLYIISDFNENSFWAFAFSSGNEKTKRKVEHLQENMLAIINKNDKIWDAGDLGFIIQGTSTEITNENITFADIEKVLEEQELLAIATGDFDLFLQTAARHRERGNNSASYRCTAEAYESTERYKEAGEEYLKANMPDKAVECYWHTLSFGASEDVIRTIAKIKSDKYKDHTQTCSIAQKAQIELSEITKILYNAVNSDLLVKEEFNIWTNIIKRISTKLKIQRYNKDTIDKCLVQRKSLKEKGIIFPSDQLARIAHRSELDSEAILLWDECTQKPKDYYELQIKRKEYPEIILYIRARNNDNWEKEIIQLFYEHGRKTNIDKTYYPILFDCIIKEGNEEDLRLLLPSMLRVSTKMAESIALVDKAKEKGLKFVDMVIQGIIRYQFTDLKEWTTKRKQDYEMNTLNALKMIDYLKEIRSQQYVNHLNSLNNERAIRSYLSEKYGFLSNTVWIYPIIFEVGKIFEKRGVYISAAQFFEWAKDQVKNQSLKRQLDYHWILMKEKKGDVQQAQERRDLLHIPLTGELPIFDDFMYWDKLYEEAFKLEPESVGNLKESNTTNRRRGTVSKSVKPETQQVESDTLEQIKETGEIQNRNEDEDNRMNTTPTSNNALVEQLLQQLKNKDEQISQLNKQIETLQSQNQELMQKLLNLL